MSLYCLIPCVAKSSAVSQFGQRRCLLVCLQTVSGSAMFARWQGDRETVVWVGVALYNPLWPLQTSLLSNAFDVCACNTNDGLRCFNHLLQSLTVTGCVAAMPVMLGVWMLSLVPL